MTPPETVENVTCLGCGCTCDDIGIVVHDGRIVEARNACHLGLGWFGDGGITATCRADGRDVELGVAIMNAAEALGRSARPLIYLAPGISCETQREAVAIADLLRARLDTTTSATAAPLVLSGQERGWASATLGEVRNRADVLVLWAVDVAGRYPRFASRYAPDPAGIHVPQGRASRTVVAIDVGSATSTIDSDHRLTVAPSDEIGALAALAALTAASHDADSRYASADGAAWNAARSLAPLLMGGHYVALVYDAEPDDREQRSPGRFDALASLSQSLNERTRCAAIALRAGGNRPGADSVLVAQTGYPMAVDFARGYPRYDPHGGEALALLRRGEVDVALFIGDPSLATPEVTDALGNVACIVVGPHVGEAPLGTSAVVVGTGVAGVHTGGTAFRTDDVPLPLHPPLAGPPAPDEVLHSLAMAIRQRA